MQFGSKQLQYYNSLTCAGIYVSKSPIFGESIQHCKKYVRAKGRDVAYVDGFCESCNGRAICAPLGEDVYIDHARLFDSMMQCSSVDEAVDYHDKIDSSAANIRDLFTARELVPVYKCPAINVAPPGAGGSRVHPATILVRGGEAADGPQQEYPFQYTCCTYAATFRAGDGHVCCPKHVPDYEDLITNHEELGSEYKAACESSETDKADFNQLHGSVRDAWIQYEGQLYFTQLEHKRLDAASAPKRKYIMLAPPPPRPLMTAREAAYIEARRKARLATTSRSEASRERQLQAADIGSGEVNQSKSDTPEDDQAASQSDTSKGALFSQSDASQGDQAASKSDTPQGDQAATKSDTSKGTQAANAPDTPQGRTAVADLTASYSQAGSGTRVVSEAGPAKKKSRKNEVEKLLA